MSRNATVTIFAIPKTFEGHIGIIQRNAIRSWAQLAGIQILLLGDEPGTAAMAQEVGARHVPQIERNEFGTPYLNSCFDLAATESNTDLLAYVNADIILMNDFTRTVARIVTRRRNFLLAGQRMDIDMGDSLAFVEGWDLTLRNRAEQEGQLRGHWAIDYFVFRKGLYGKIPPFAIGRWAWDNWLLYEGIRRGAHLIDATPSILAVHQSHGYDHQGDLRQPQKTGPEATANRALAPEHTQWYSLLHATEIAHPWGFCPAWSPERVKRRAHVWKGKHPKLAVPIDAVKRLWRAIRG